MIHLDRSHHHDLDQSQKQNLILSRDHDAPHFDWDTPDNSSFFHDALHDALHSQQPLSPHNIHLPSESTTSPAHQVRDDKSSSLSPAPDSGSPAPQQNTAPVTPSQILPLPTAQDKQEQDLAVEGTLTPLTELSPAPDLDDTPEDNKDAPDEHKVSSHPNPSSTSQDGPSRDRRVQPTLRINGTSSPPTVSITSPSRLPSTIDVRLNGSSPLAGGSHSRTSSGEFLVPPLPSNMSVPAAGNVSSDSKVVRILDINTELFKVCLEFQSRGISISDSRFQQYAMRLQVNLTWLAAAADQRHNSPNITLPIMEPPIAVEFVSMDRIQHLYSDMSMIFAKDVARRQLLNATHQGPSTGPSAAPNGAMKRTRPDDLPDLASKRRDVGENKMQVAQAPPVISLSNAPPHSNPASTFPPPNQSNIAMSAAQTVPQSPRVSSPAMPPPSASPSLPFGATEASIAASTRARARELQIQQAREQHIRQATQMQQMQAGRHMSPPSTSQPVPQGVAGGQPSMASNMAFGPQAHPILQNPNHPIMQYMIQQIPQFMSLPPQQQMQKIQIFQTALAQRQQPQQLQNPQVTTPQRNPQMVSMAPNTSMPMMPNGTLNTGGGPSPVSPLAQQSPVMSQQQQQSQVTNQPAQNGMFAFGQGPTNPGMDPRMAGSNFSSQMPGGMPNNNMNTNQQRLMLMQQQMRNANGNMNAVPNMMNSQQHAYNMAQRMAQAGSSQSGTGTGGSPMSAPAGDQFPALRSNSTIPGIARSARSPSDGLHSPMTPRAPSRLSQQPQLAQNDFSQGMMQQSHVAMAQNPGAYNPQIQNHNWPQSGQQPLQQQQMGMVTGQMNGYSMTSPNSAGIGGGFFGAMPSSSSSNWQPQQGMTGSYPYGQSMGAHPQSDQGRLSHMAVTGMSMPQNMNPMADASGAPGEYDIFNYTGS